MNAQESTLHISWPEDLANRKDLLAKVQKANKILDEQLGQSPIVIAADWKKTREGPDGAILELTLTDLFTQSQVVEKFTSDMLEDESRLWSRIHRMWGRLLSARTDAQLKSLRELAGQAEGV